MNAIRDKKKYSESPYLTPMIAQAPKAATVRITPKAVY
jgi:hypothetical protein